MICTKWRLPAVYSEPRGTQSVDGAQIEKACEAYGVEFVGPLPDGD